MKTSARFAPPLSSLQHRLLVAGTAFVALAAIAHAGRAAWPVALAALVVGIGAHLGVVGVVLLLAYAALGWLTRILRVRDVLRIVEALALRGDETVLDLGTGDGIVAIAVAKRLESGRVIASDDWRRAHGSRKLSAALVEHNARAEGVGARVHVLTSPFERLDLADASVDRAVACLSLHHLPAGDRARAVSELVRVLRPGGTILLAEPFRRVELARGLERAGFTVTHGGITFPRWLFGWITARRAAR
ncbi:MAG TPA: class I SAM-dependent methyltransferase [Polyangiaceae bacterium]|nr:class I SAM-dependent methyltransferase [Polyangiaceae bacterium]